ncbi:MAG: GNAT family N-acetyltransferase [Kiritimatiellae bacterium]|nr:GNAT family N-acetyltransferase [Kiritimatiellia bacterium]
MPDSEEAKIAIRQARLGDAFAIYELIKANADNLIVRPIGDIVRNIDRFTVAMADGRVVACASYTIWPEPGRFERSMVELTSVVVSKEMRGRGFGAIFVRDVLARVARFRPSIAIVLTYSPAFFEHLGFREIPKTEVMHKIYAGCVNCTKQVDPFVCPEVAMGLELGDDFE